MTGATLFQDEAPAITPPAPGVVQFFTAGHPVAKGSMKAFRNPKTGAIITTHAAKGLQMWANRVHTDAVEAWGDRPLLRHGLMLSLEFRFTRPQSHFRKDGTLRPNAPVVYENQPDFDKIERAVLDALTNAIYVDDRFVVGHDYSRKVYAAPGEPEGVLVGVRPL